MPYTDSPAAKAEPVVSPVDFPTILKGPAEKEAVPDPPASAADPVV